MIKTVTYTLIILIMVSCSANPYRKISKLQNHKIDSLKKELSVINPTLLYDSLNNQIETAYIPTVNLGLRKPNFVIIHHTAQDSLAQTIRTFTLESTQVSAHYIISESGKIIHLLNNNLRTWHAGASKWGNITDINSCSIGIELANNGKQPFTNSQINSLLILLAKLKKDYNIPTANFIGHADVAPKRKTDPSIFFPWEKLSQNGFGMWYNKPDLLPPLDFDVENALRRIGYNTSDLNAAIVAFKLHFVKLDLQPTLTNWDRCVLYNLYKKY
ncbi:MAG: N-acetylmuramoyl-L-alanine amidase [Sphingobacteriales bacterium]|nr:MAG: N-acetylmuramoyl-L-alanine amidase [Sphingobacteriales bacterium]